MTQAKDIPQKYTRFAFSFLPAERLLLAIVFAAEFIAIATAVALKRDVEWPPFLVGFSAAIGFVAIGAYIRDSKDADRFALALVSIGIFSGFMAAASVLIFALLPLPNPMIDDWLTRTEHMIGYDWRALVMALMDYPLAMQMLGLVYDSILPQMVITILLLAAVGRALLL